MKIIALIFGVVFLLIPGTIIGYHTGDHHIWTAGMVITWMGILKD